MESKNMFYRGYVDLLVLKFLSEKDCYGYEIVKSIRRASDEKISLSVGTLYPTLYKLIDQKYISDYKKQTGERMVKVYYHLENSGRERLNTLVAEYLEFSQVMNKILNLE